MLGDECRNIRTRRDIQIFWNMVVESIFSFTNQIIDWLFNSGKILEFSLNPINGKLTTSPSSAGSTKRTNPSREIAVWHFFAQFFCEFTCIDFHRNRFQSYELSRLLQASCFSQFTWTEGKFTILHFICVSIHQHFQGTIGI